MKGVLKMIITLKDGSKKEYASPMSIIDIAKDISEGLARAACVGEVDGEVILTQESMRTDTHVHMCSQRQLKICIQMPRGQLDLLSIMVFTMTSTCQL